MAIIDNPTTATQAAASQPIDIEAWTEQATAAMSSVTISAAAVSTANGPAVTLAIPLDTHDEATAAPARPAGAVAAAKEGGYYRRKEPLRRDSLKRREALLKGKEGSRRRQRWENDRLLNNPYAEPPAPRDWEIHPTHRVTHVPYYLAPLWDAGLKRSSADRRAAAHISVAASKTAAAKPTAPGVVPKELREKLKRSRGAKGLLMDLEGEVRAFVQDWAEREERAEADGLPADLDSEDEEIVFVGRNGQMADERAPGSAQAKRQLMLFETPVEDVGGSFGRWLVHHIGVYYGLSTWSVTVGNPARREAYVGLKERRMKARHGQSCVGAMPRPLWGMV